MKRVISGTDVIALVVAALLIWGGKDPKTGILSAAMLVVAGMLVGVAVNKVSLRLRKAKK
jgi:hypothetical protein